MASRRVYGVGVVWIADLLPHEFKTYVAGNIEKGLGLMKRTLERR